MTTRFLVIVAVAAILAGCGSGEGEVKTNPPTPPPTEAQLKEMPPEAAKHAQEMDAYTKSMSQRQGSQGR
jgi:hypothetical protein